MMDLAIFEDRGTWIGTKLMKGLGIGSRSAMISTADPGRETEGKKTSIKAAILDQKLVVGVGQHLCLGGAVRIRHRSKRMAYTVQGERAEKLAAAIKAVLREAIAAGGSSLRDYVQTDGELGYFQKQWRVYDREGQPHAELAAEIPPNHVSFDASPKAAQCLLPDLPEVGGTNRAPSGRHCLQLCICLYTKG